MPAVGNVGTVGSGDAGDIGAPSGVCGNGVAASSVFQRFFAGALVSALAFGGEGGAALPEAMCGRLMAQAQTAAGVRFESCSFLR